jgi:hypothetical protein
MTFHGSSWTARSRYDGVIGETIWLLQSNDLERSSASEHEWNAITTLPNNNLVGAYISPIGNRLCCIAHSPRDTSDSVVMARVCHYQLQHWLSFDGLPAALVGDVRFQNVWNIRVQRSHPSFLVIIMSWRSVHLDFSTTMLGWLMLLPDVVVHFSQGYALSTPTVYLRRIVHNIIWIYVQQNFNINPLLPFLSSHLSIQFAYVR